MRMYYRIDIRDEEIEQTDVNLIEWAFEHMVKEFHRNAPHGPINMSRHYDFQMKMHRLQIDAEWKEPVQ